MKLCKVTGILSTAKHLPQLEGVSLVQLQDGQGEVLAAADLLGVQVGDQVLVTCASAPSVLGTNQPADALVLCVLAAP